MASPSAQGDTFRKCPDCGSMIPEWQRRHRARWCPGYSELWAGDVRVKLFAAVRAYGDLCRVSESRVLLLTVTGPGEDAGLVWDADVCAHKGPHRHSGTHGCKVAAAPAAAWNDRAPSWWTELHRQASQAAHRATGRRPVLIARPWELQRRGVLHVHPLLGYSTPAEKSAADAYQAELVSRASRHGFGYVDRKRQVREPTAAAAYLSSYFVAGRKGKMTLRESVTSGAMPPSIVYVSPVFSQHSGVTMRSLRLKRYLWAVAGQAWMWLHCEQGFQLDDLVRAHRAGLTFLQVATAHLSIDT